MFPRTWLLDVLIASSAWFSFANIYSRTQWSQELLECNNISFLMELLHPYYVILRLAKLVLVSMWCQVYSECQVQGSRFLSKYTQLKWYIHCMSSREAFLKCSPKNSKCQLVSKFWHLELFHGVYCVIWHFELFWGDHLKKAPCI